MISKTMKTNAPDTDRKRALRSNRVSSTNASMDISTATSEAAGSTEGSARDAPAKPQPAGSASLLSAPPLASANAAVSASLSPPPSDHAPPSPSKRSLVIGMLERDDGATLAELCAATGWQAHSMRAVLTGLRKRGFVIEKSLRGGATCYQILGGTA